MRRTVSTFTTIALLALPAAAGAHNYFDDNGPLSSGDNVMTCSEAIFQVVATHPSWYHGGSTGRANCISQINSTAWNVNERANDGTLLHDIADLDPTGPGMAVFDTTYQH